MLPRCSRFQLNWLRSAHFHRFRLSRWEDPCVAPRSRDQSSPAARDDRPGHLPTGTSRSPWCRTDRATCLLTTDLCRRPKGHFAARQRVSIGLPDRRFPCRMANHDHALSDTKELSRCTAGLRETWDGFLRALKTLRLLCARICALSNCVACTIDANFCLGGGSNYFSEKSRRSLRGASGQRGAEKIGEIA